MSPDAARKLVDSLTRYGVPAGALRTYLGLPPLHQGRRVSLLETLRTTELATVAPLLQAAREHGHQVRVTGKGRFKIVSTAAIAAEPKPKKRSTTGMAGPYRKHDHNLRLRELLDELKASGLTRDQIADEAGTNSGRLNNAYGGYVRATSDEVEILQQLLDCLSDESNESTESDESTESSEHGHVPYRAAEEMPEQPDQTAELEQHLTALVQTRLAPALTAGEVVAYIQGHLLEVAQAMTQALFASLAQARAKAEELDQLQREMRRLAEKRARLLEQPIPEYDSLRTLDSEGTLLFGGRRYVSGALQVLPYAHVWVVRREAGHLDVYDQAGDLVASNVAPAGQATA